MFHNVRLDANLAVEGLWDASLAVSVVTVAPDAADVSGEASVGPHKTTAVMLTRSLLNTCRRFAC